MKSKEEFYAKLNELREEQIDHSKFGLKYDNERKEISQIEEKLVNQRSDNLNIEFINNHKWLGGV